MKLKPLCHLFEQNSYFYNETYFLQLFEHEVNFCVPIILRFYLNNIIGLRQNIINSNHIILH
jgi:hypothetical protein